MKSNELPAAVEAMRSRILALARHLGSRDPERVYQEVCIRCWRRCDLLNKCCNQSAWILKVTRRAVVSIYRQDRCRFAHRSDETGVTMRPRGWRQSEPPFDVEQAEVIAVVRSSVSNLPAQYRDVIVACDIDGRSIPDFATEIGRPEETCRTRQKRARQRLADVPALQALWSSQFQ